MAAAYRKGIKDAEGKLRQHIVAQKEQWSQVRAWAGWVGGVVRSDGSTLALRRRESHEPGLTEVFFWNFHPTLPHGGVARSCWSGRRR